MLQLSFCRNIIDSCVFPTLQQQHGDDSQVCTYFWSYSVPQFKEQHSATVLYFAKITSGLIPGPICALSFPQSMSILSLITLFSLIQPVAITEHALGNLILFFLIVSQLVMLHHWIAPLESCLTLLPTNTWPVTSSS